MSLSLRNKKSSMVAALISLFCVHFVKAQSARNTDIKFLSDTTATFQQLISQFKGKIVYVDIWATWCGPCRQELKKTKDVQGFADFAKKNNIVILYICADNNTKAWKQFINANKLAGYHIMAGQAMDKDFHTTFSSVQLRNGVMKRSFYIPRHIIIDQSGVIVDSTADSQGKAIVYKRLDQLLRKLRS